MAAVIEAASAVETYIDHVNPRWAQLLRVLQMDAEYALCSGVELHTKSGDAILDFLSGYCVHNAGHNHPAIIEALHRELDRRGPAMLQSHVPDLAGELAARLCRLAGGGLEKAFFASSGSEGVEAAIKFARVTTGRAGLLHCDGAFHGLTCGALSLMSEPYWRGKFGPMLGDTASVPFGDIDALREKLRTKNYAAFFVEPVQSEAGIIVPAPEYLNAAKELCSRFGTLLVLDEVQTGLYRTGKFIAAHHFHVEPDMVILAKALSGGLVPVSAVLMTDRIYNSVFDSLKRAIVHTSTFGENGLAMRAGLATLDVLQSEDLGARAFEMGVQLRRRLHDELRDYEMVAEVRGLGMLSGIAFRPPKSLRLRVAFESFQRIHPAMFGQVLVMRIFRDQRMLTQMCGNNFMVLKVAPPLVVSQEQIETFTSGIRQVIHLAHRSAEFWTEAIGLAKRTVNI
jgi:ornithine--oxo-acid transaminase